jgi:TatD DNase family protein
MQEFNPTLIDTHGHVSFNAFKEDGDEVIQRALDNGVGIILPGTQIDTSTRAVELAEKWDHPYIRAAIGLHPIHLEDIEVDESEVETQAKFQTRKEEYRRALYQDILNSTDKVVAIGEIGLDYWRLPEDEEEQERYKRVQIDTLVNQIGLAFRNNLPLILHSRKAHDDLLSIVESHEIVQTVHPPGVVHCYTGRKTHLKSFLALGFYIGFNGIIFKMNLDDVIKATPLDRILLETDSPYLTPPQVVSERNEPIHVEHVAEYIAHTKKVFYKEVVEQTTENAKRVFRLGQE